ncbi:hypothetical protein DFH09DRAFT_4793 [Mycena vulgaris]|nr:hypothetical protein DFH09DRAFT_4793 [Mycena vulgaris]
MARTSTTSTSKRSSVRAPKTSSGTKRALVAARKLRRERAASWKRWCAANCWQPGPDTLYYEHLPHEIVMYRTYVKPHFQLNDAELSTLPCMELSDPERSRKSRTYVYSDIMNLVYRKFAVISGEDAYDCPYALLEKGRVLFDNEWHT